MEIDRPVADPDITEELSSREEREREKTFFLKTQETYQSSLH